MVVAGTKVLGLATQAGMGFWAPGSIPGVLVAGGGHPGILFQGPQQQVGWASFGALAS